MRACTHVRVLCMINYRVHVYKLHDRRIPKVRVGVRVRVGPVEFKLNHVKAVCVYKPT